LPDTATAKSKTAAKTKTAAKAKATAKAAPQTTPQKLDEIFKDVNRSDAPGLVIGVRQHGELLYRRGFGLASVELSVANTPWTRMRIGSTSKHFTSLAALLLAEDGKLDIDAGVRTYLPELPDLQPEATVRQLMSHTSGYRCYLDVSFLSDGMAIQPKGAALATQVRQTGVNFPPGERMIYCNGGYHMLSVIIERVSGVEFEKFLKDRIFDPLGMLDTASVPSDFNIERGAAGLYVPLPTGGYRPRHLPDGGSARRRRHDLHGRRHAALALHRRRRAGAVVARHVVAAGSRREHPVGLGQQAGVGDEFVHVPIGLVLRQWCHHKRLVIRK